MSASAAAKRRAAYDQRIARATTDRERVHALVWWWMAELKQLLPARQIAERDRLEAITAGLGEGRRPDDAA